MKKIILFSMSLVLLVSCAGINCMHGKRVDNNLLRKNDQNTRGALNDARFENKLTKDENRKEAKEVKHESVVIKQASVYLALTNK